MATITPTLRPKSQNMTLSSGSYDIAIRNLVATTLGSSDTFRYLAGTGQILILRNPTGSTITPLFNGSNTEFQAPGLGVRSTSAGYSFPITAGQVKMVQCDTIREHLKLNDFTITNGAGLVAYLINPIA